MRPCSDGSLVSESIVYYVPTIPDVWSTDRYQHALGLVEAADESVVVSNAPVPDSLAKRTTTQVVDAESVLSRGRAAASVATSAPDSTTFVTSYHYEAVLAGSIAKQRGVRWVPDVYETPAQYRLNQPRTYHQVTARGLAGLLHQAERAVHSFHPETPYQYGSDRRFLPNGAPVSIVDPAYADRSTLHVAWVGSPRLDRGGELLVEALARVDSSLVVDVYGTTDPHVESLAAELGVDDVLRFNGRVPHRKALDGVREADVGYCVLPPRTDWRYAPPIKVGEYLAGATIPLVSDFPGMRYIAKDAGRYVAPRPDAVATALDDLSALSLADRHGLAEAARERGEEIAWEEVRAEFARQVGVR